MAQIGLRYPVAAPIMTYNPDGMPIWNRVLYWKSHQSRQDL